MRHSAAPGKKRYAGSRRRMAGITQKAKRAPALTGPVPHGPQNEGCGPLRNKTLCLNHSTQARSLAIHGVSPDPIRAKGVETASQTNGS
jgi:hypothetical protein